MKQILLLAGWATVSMGCDGEGQESEAEPVLDSGLDDQLSLGKLTNDGAAVVQLCQAVDETLSNSSLRRLWCTAAGIIESPDQDCSETATLCEMSDFSTPCLAGLGTVSGLCSATVGQFEQCANDLWAALKDALAGLSCFEDRAALEQRVAKVEFPECESVRACVQYDHWCELPFPGCF